MRPERQRQARGEARRRDILLATLALVRRGGIAAVTSRAVAREARVPLGSLSYYFDGKDDLLEQALLLHVDEEVGRLRAISDALAAGDDEPDPEHAARAFTAVLDEDDLATIAQFELYLEAARSPALREAAARCFAAYEEVVTAALAAAGLPDPASAAPLFLAFADGRGLRQLAAPASAPALDEGLLRLFAALTAGGITPRP
jgi:DNA-binding transcriptional regulator YbjK